MSGNTVADAIAKALAESSGNENTTSTVRSVNTESLKTTSKSGFLA